MIEELRAAARQAIAGRLTPEELDRELAAPLSPAERAAILVAQTARALDSSGAALRALEAGVLDELQIHQIPVLFGRGRRLFDQLPSRIELEIVRVIDTPEATHIRYRVRR